MHVGEAVVQSDQQRDKAERVYSSVARGSEALWTTQREFIMIETAKYCHACIDKLFPATAQTEKEKQFLAAHTFAPRPATDYGPTTEDGTCEKCGQRSVVMYYRLPA